MNQLLHNIETQGWYYQKDVFSLSFIQALKKEQEKLLLKEATIGKNKTLNTDIRSDKISWLYHHKAECETQKYFAWISELKSTLNRHFYFGLQEFEGHFAQYDKGNFYKPHKDNVKGSNKRVITTITYLNENWTTQDGGQLRLHLNKMIDIEPVAGSVIVFLSKDIEHEVLPAFATRQAITGWLLSS